MKSSNKTVEGGSVPLQVIRATIDDVSETHDTVAIEEPLEIRLSRRLASGAPGSAEVVAITMRTPGHDAELAAGFLWTEGMIGVSAELERVEPPRLTIAGRPANTIDVYLNSREGERHFGERRKFFINSSCGVCGKSSIQALHTARPAFRAAPAFHVEAAVIASMPQTLRKAQQLFERTGGLHAAALFSAEGELLLVREDVGRHNAVDKLVGALLLENRLPADERVLLVSGRTSFELVQKAAMAGIQFIAAVGAPSSLAVSTALTFGMTLVGFIREGRFNIYAGSQRVIQAAHAAAL